MKKRKLVVFLSILGATLLLAISCSAPAQTATTAPPTASTTTAPKTTTAPPQTTKPSDKPQYGGTLTLALTSDLTIFDDIVTVGFGPGQTNRLTNNTLWEGDWAKGDAGGYGTGKSPWLDWYDIFSDKAGSLATSWKWTIDAASNQSTLVYQIRQGVHFALDPASDASRLVNGQRNDGR